ncbi:hypothetical protein [Paenibacillus sp. N3.4]|uniref:hypothetical protein n=1 Tax=Paenibacillus sp. N3.4 TaxID=2603222 RepID=UPI0011C78819|nr:hypothetical protein [Paenibacillus sp. N3.4]TXK76378.1 hypothetical protein FU659_25535 [Paenibacillus sp. N3.4]
MKKHLNVVLSLSVLAGSILLVSGCSGSPTSAASAQLPSVKVITLGSTNAAGASGKLAADQTVQVVSKWGVKLRRFKWKKAPESKKAICWFNWIPRI